MGREEGGGFRMGNTCFKIIKLKIKIKRKKKKRDGMEKAMAPHSSVLAWRIPGTGEPSGLPSMGSHRVGHD